MKTMGELSLQRDVERKNIEKAFREAICKSLREITGREPTRGEVDIVYNNIRDMW